MPAAGRRVHPPHRSPARRERARVVARRHAARLRGAGGRSAGAGVRGGQAQVEASARDHHHEVPVERRGLHLRPAPADLRGGRGRRRRRASSPRATTTTPIPRGRRTGARSCSRRPATTTATTTTPPTSGSWRPTGGAPRRLTATAGPAGHAAFSPAGRHASPTWGGPRPTRSAATIRLFAIPATGGAPALSHRRLRPLLLAARACRRSGVPTAAPSPSAAEDQGSLGVYRGAGRRRAGHARSSRASGSSAASPCPATARPSAFAASEPDCPGRGLRLRPRTAAARSGSPTCNRDWKREVALSRSGALPLRAGRHDGGRLDHEAVRLRGRQALSPAPQRARRPARPVRLPVPRRVPGPGGRGLRGALHQPARQPGIRRSVHPRGGGRLGRRATRRTCRPASTRRCVATTGSIPSGWACWAAATAGS